MRIPQAGVLIQDDVDFNIEFVARVIGLQSLDLLDRLCEAHGEIQEHVAFIRSSSRTGEIADMRSDGRRPVVDHVE